MDTTVLWSDVASGAPAWQKGYLVPSGLGWNAFYGEEASAYVSGWSGGPLHSTRTLYQRFVVNVWPTGPSGYAGSDAFGQECARRKCLAVAAFSWAIGEWLAGVDAALRTLEMRVYDVVDTIDIGNELDQFWWSPGARGIPEFVQECAALEAGRYLALLAGPIRAQLSEMRFRTEVSTWGGQTGDDDFGRRLAFLRAVLTVGVVAEVAWWREVELARRFPTSSHLNTESTAAWFATEAAAGLGRSGFQWPMSPPSGAWAPGDLVHQVGIHWYHSYDLDNNRAPNTELYQDAGRAESDVRALLALAEELRDRFSLGVTFGEVAFPAVDPGGKKGKMTNWAASYQHTSDTLQAAMHLRLLSTLLASGVELADLYGFRHGSPECFTVPVNHGSCFATWNEFNAMGVHNDIFYQSGGGANYEQGVDCWPRPTWFTFRRFAWLLRRVGTLAGRRATTRLRLVWNAAGLTVIELPFFPSLDMGPDGEPLDARYPRAYLFWRDQYALDVSPACRVEFAFDAGGAAPAAELLPVVPALVPGVSGADANGFARPTGVDWEWPGWAAAAGLREPRVLRITLPDGSGRSFLRLDVEPTDPSTGVALAPLCLLTNGQFVAVR